MTDRIKEIPARFVEFWNKYTSKQKTIIIAVLCVVLVLIAVVGYLVSRPTWTKLTRFKELDDASSLVNELDAQGIANKSSKDGLTIYVHDNKMTDAFYSMSDANLVDKGYTWDKAFDNSLSTTESEKSQKRLLALQSDIKKSIEKYSFVDDADIIIDVPESTYSILDEENDTSITARISVNQEHADQLDSDTSAALAGWLANAVGTDLEHVLINDSEGNCLYNGSVGDGLGGSITGGISEFTEKLRNTIANNVTKVMIKSGYDDVEVGLQGLRFNTSKIERLTKTYSVDEGRDYGYPTNYYHYKTEGNSGTTEGIPGTDSNDNDEVDYYLNPGGNSTSSLETERLEQCLTNETIENMKQEIPAIEYDNSSMGIVLIRNRVYDEEQMENDGTLDGTTFEEFMAANNTRTQITIPDEERQLIAATTGVDADRIQVVAYEVPRFVEKTSSGRTLSDYLMIILAVLIIALLIFVVLRGTAPLKVDETEPELSVEQLLATTRENQSLEDIEFSDKSETRKLIEKFVDENPEAVAQLLRNWISDDWE